MSTFQTSKKRIRKNFDPLITAVHFQMKSAVNTLIQTYDVATESYVPDRSSDPLVIFPYVNAQASDGSWVNGNANHLISNIKWYINDVDITTSREWVGKYSIVTASGAENRGAITITKNVASDAKIDLSFSCSIPDTRLGVNVSVISESLHLTTVDKSEDDWSIYIDQADIVNYSPMNDALLLHDYLTANGIDSTTPTDLRYTYDFNVEVSVLKGVSEAVASDYTLELYEVSSAGVYGDAVTISNNTFALDLRTIERATYVIVCKYNDLEVTRKQFSIVKVDPKLTVKQRDMPSMSASDVYLRSKLIVEANGSVVSYPALHFDITWYSDSQYRTGVVQDYGEYGTIKIANTGAGSDFDDSWIEVYAEVGRKGVYKESTDSDGNTYTDADGNAYINN